MSARDLLANTIKFAISALVILACGVLSFLISPRANNTPSLSASAQTITFLHGPKFITPSTITPMRRSSTSETSHIFNEQWTTPWKIDDRAKPDVKRQFDYILTMDGIESDQEYAVFIPFSGGHSILFFNGIVIEQSKRAVHSPIGFGGQTLLATIPQSYMQPGLNRINIITSNHALDTGLKSFYFGKMTQIKPLATKHNRHMKNRQYFISLVGVFLIGFSCLPLAFNGFRSNYVWPCTAMLIFAVLLIAPSHSRMLALHYPFGVPEQWHIMAFILKASLLLSVNYFTTPDPDQPDHKDPLVLGLVGFSIVSLVTGAFPLLRPSIDPLPIFGVFSDIGLIPLALYVCFRTIKQSANQHITRLDQLAKAIEEKDQILATKEQELQAQLRKSVIHDERARITRDMHDGIGGQLLSLLVRVRSGKLSMPEIETNLQDGINDLRLIVDSMDDHHQDMGLALATFRTRTKAQLDAAGINLIWKQSLETTLPAINTRTVLSLYRLLQEAVSNAVRHAKADTIQISVIKNPDDQTTMICVQDNGQGITGQNDQPVHGKGLKNMAFRAKQMGAKFSVTYGIDQKGFGVEIVLPNQLDPID